MNLNHCVSPNGLVIPTKCFVRNFLAVETYLEKKMSNSFISLANIRLPSPSRLLENACCPDKDLVVLFSRLGGADRMSLWNSNQGSRVWEADIGTDNTSSHVVGIAWSPDGMSRLTTATCEILYLRMQDRASQSFVILQLYLSIHYKMAIIFCRFPSICLQTVKNMVLILRESGGFEMKETHLIPRPSPIYSRETILLYVFMI
jgi:WD40 repeat protein